MLFKLKCTLLAFTMFLTANAFSVSGINNQSGHFCLNNNYNQLLASNKKDKAIESRYPAANAHYAPIALKKTSRTAAPVSGRAKLPVTTETMVTAFKAYNLTNSPSFAGSIKPNYLEESLGPGIKKLLKLGARYMKPKMMTAEKAGEQAIVDLGEWTAEHAKPITNEVASAAKKKLWEYNLESTILDDVWVEVIPPSAQKMGSPSAACDKVDLKFLEENVADSKIPKAFSKIWKSEDGQNSYESKFIKLSKTSQADGVSSFNTAIQGLEEGSSYRLLVKYNDTGKKLHGTEFKKTRDPFAHEVSYGTQSEWAKTYEHTKFNWPPAEEAWGEASNLKKYASRDVDPQGSHVRPNILQVHIGSYEKGLQDPKLLEDIKKAKDAGYNGVVFLPVNMFPGHGWGYEGIGHTTITPAYGPMDDLKKVIGQCHEMKMNAGIDVVYNHFGPFDNKLHEVFDLFDSHKSTPWGSAIKYEGKGSAPVRDMTARSDLYWIYDVHADFLRKDMTEYLYSDGMLKEGSIRIRENPDTRQTLIHLEDGRRDPRLVSPLQPQEYLTSELAEKAVQSARKGDELDKNYISKVGADGVWSFADAHTLQAIATGQVQDGYSPSLRAIEKIAKEGTVAPGLPGSGTVKFPDSHDESGNHGGLLLIHKIIRSYLDLGGRAKNGSGLLGDESTRELLKSYIALQKKAEGKPFIKEYAELLDPTNPERAAQLQLEKGYISHKAQAVTLDAFDGAFKTAQKRTFATRALNRVLGTEGATQDFRPWNLEPFPFHADWPDQKLVQQVSNEKGFNIKTQAYQESKLHQEQYNHSQYEAQAINMLRDVSKVVDENQITGKATSTYIHSEADVFQAVKKDKAGNEYIIVYNNSNKNYDNFNLLQLPAKGKWKLEFSTDRPQYGGSGKYENFKEFATNDGGTGTISLPQASTMIFKKVP